MEKVWTCGGHVRAGECALTPVPVWACMSLMSPSGLVAFTRLLCLLLQGERESVAGNNNNTKLCRGGKMRVDHCTDG